jgi:hypothetical protein
MDRATMLEQLAQIEQHVAQGERHIAEQQERIAHFARRGYQSTEALKLLDNFYATQLQHLQHRDRLRERLEQ